MNEKNKEFTCCFTGHRNIEISDQDTIDKRILQQVEELSDQGVNHFVCGGAYGFDMRAGFVVLMAQKRHPAIRLTLVLPCKDQDSRWTSATRTAYRELLDEANDIEYISDVYHPECMKDRNQRMVEMSSVCIAYLRRQASGAGQTVRMAQARGLRVILL